MLGKLLLLSLAIAAIWFGFRWWQRQQQRSEVTVRPSDPATGPGNATLLLCAACDRYIAVGARPCDRANCPRPRV